MIKRIIILLGAIFFSSYIFAAAHTIDLVVEYKEVEFAGETRKAISVNNQIPAPKLHFEEGDEVTINVYNELDEETAIHWHGMLVPWQMDGVLGVTQKGIQPGEMFQYHFTLEQSGTYWYHAHAGLQEQQGLYGAFIIDPKKNTEYQYTKDYVVVLSDWSNTHPNNILKNLKKAGDYYSPRFPLQPSLVRFIRDYSKADTAEKQNLVNDYKMMQQMRMGIYDISDVAYDAFLLNGRPNTSPWTAPVTVGDIVRLRFIGAGGSTIFRVKIPGTTLKIVHVQGNDVEPYVIDDFTIGSGETYDVLVEIKEDNPYIIYAESADTLGAAYGALITESQQTVNYKDVVPFPEPLPVTREMMQNMMASTMNPNMNSHSMPSMQMTPSSMNLDHAMMHMENTNPPSSPNAAPNSISTPSTPPTDTMKMDPSMSMNQNVPMDNMNSHSMMQNTPSSNSMSDMQMSSSSMKSDPSIMNMGKTNSQPATKTDPNNSPTQDTSHASMNNTSTSNPPIDTMKMDHSMSRDQMAPMSNMNNAMGMSNHNMNMMGSSMAMNAMTMPIEPSIIGDRMLPANQDLLNINTTGTKYQNLSAAIPTNDPDLPVDGIIQMELFGYMERFIWFINGVPAYNAPPIVLDPAKRYRIIFTNNSMMHHPMHIHGHWFILRNGHGAFDPLLHTIDVAPGATVTTDIDTDASGQWFFHCHFLYHMETGMSRVFQYSSLIEITKAEAMPQNIVEETNYYNRPIVRVDEVRPIDMDMVMHPMAHPKGLYLSSFLDVGADPFNNIQRLNYKGLYGPDYNKLELFINDAELNDGIVENADIDVFYWRLISQFWAVKAGANYFYRPAHTPYWQPGAGIEGLVPYFIDVNARLYYHSGSAKLDVELSRDTQITNNFFLRAGVRSILASSAVPEAEIGSGLNQMRYLIRPFYRLMPGLDIFMEFEHEQSYGETSDFFEAANEDTIVNSLTFGLSVLF
ncbi:MAG: multicopper oxidase domain-containing protein [Legionellales bacterium]